MFSELFELVVGVECCNNTPLNNLTHMYTLPTSSNPNSGGCSAYHIVIHGGFAVSRIFVGCFLPSVGQINLIESALLAEERDKLVQAATLGEEDRKGKVIVGTSCF